LEVILKFLLGKTFKITQIYSRSTKVSVPDRSANLSSCGILAVPTSTLINGKQLQYLLNERLMVRNSDCFLS